MVLTEKQAFQLGFMYRCAEEGLTGNKLKSRLATLEKSALEKKALPSLTNMAWNLGTNVLSLPVLASVTAGGLAGHVAGSTMEPSVNEDDLKASELISTYKAYASRARARRRARTYRPPTM